MEAYIEVAVLTIFSDGDARPDTCGILVECYGDIGPISDPRLCNASWRAPATSVSEIRDIYLGEVDRERRQDWRRLWGGGRRGYCCADTKDNRGGKEFHGERS